MNKRSPSLPARTGQQLMELAFAVPQVVAHRVTRMALAGPSPSARDRREFHLMGAEKEAAFRESWLAMSMQGAMAQQRMALELWRACFWPWTAPKLDWDGHAMLHKGLAPVHKRAVANAKRLGRTPLR